MWKYIRFKFLPTFFCGNFQGLLNVVFAQGNIPGTSTEKKWWFFAACFLFPACSPPLPLLKPTSLLVFLWYMWVDFIKTWVQCSHKHTHWLCGHSTCTYKCISCAHILNIQRCGYTYRHVHVHMHRSLLRKCISKMLAFMLITLMRWGNGDGN